MPNAARMSIACPCAPSVRRSGLRRCDHPGVLDAEATTSAFNVPVAIFAFLFRQALLVIPTGILNFNIYQYSVVCRHPPGPPARDKWPFWALGGHRLL